MSVHVTSYHAELVVLGSETYRFPCRVVARLSGDAPRSADGSNSSQASRDPFVRAMMTQGSRMYNRGIKREVPRMSPRVCVLALGHDSPRNLDPTPALSQERAGDTFGTPLDVPIYAC